MKIILIVGLPASGKTHLGRKLAEEQNLKLIDDPFLLDDIKPDLNKNGLVICDPHLCKWYTRKTAELTLKSKYPTTSLEWIFFENDRKSCLSNLKIRQSQGDNRNVRMFIYYLSTQYELIPGKYGIPEGSQVIPVWKANNER